MDGERLVELVIATVGDLDVDGSSIGGAGPTLQESFAHHAIDKSSRTTRRVDDGVSNFTHGEPALGGLAESQQRFEPWQWQVTGGPELAIELTFEPGVGV